MKILEFDVGDKVWLHGHHEPGTVFKLFPWPRFEPKLSGRGGLFEGKVILEYQRQGMKYYVVEVDTHIEPIQYVRDGLTLSDSPDKPIGMFRRNRGSNG